MKALRNKKKDAEKNFVTRFLKLIEEERDHIVEKIEEERPKIREMSTMKPEDVHRRMTI